MMKINRIKKIQKYKSFCDFNWQPYLNNQNFHPEVNIFYGENGSGKSSICNLFKSVSCNKDFGKYKPAETCLSFNCGVKKYPVSTDWDSKLPKDSILFFDREFVDKNVHLGHKRDTTQNGHEQESGKMIIEFDKEAINLRSIRDETKKEKEDADQKIKNYNIANSDILNFNLAETEKKLYRSYKNKSELELRSIKQNIIQAKKEIEKGIEIDLASQMRISDIQNDINPLSNIKLESPLSSEKTYQAVFNFKLKEQSVIRAEQTLVNKIKNNKDFFEIGFEIMEENPNICPFCQSPKKETQITKIIDLYNQIYDETYKVMLTQFENDRASLLEEIEKIIYSLASLNLGNIFLELKNLDENYKLANIYSVKDEQSFIKPETKSLYDLSSKLKKLKKPNKENIKEAYTSAKLEYNGIKNFHKRLNQFINEKNKIIASFIADNTDEKLKSRNELNNFKLTELENKLEFINQNKINKQKNKEAKEKELKKLQNKFQRIKIKSDIAIKQYEEYCSSSAFSNVLNKIQEYFESFNFNFQLELKTDPTGNKTEFPFAFKILDCKGNERDFKEGLSEGEIQVLSLCFFFAFLSIQKNLKNKILVFDDPITSLDNSNLSCLVDLIAKEQANFSQTFIFTHHRTFFKFLKKRFDQHCCEYNIIRNKAEFGGSFICKSSTEKFIEKLGNFEASIASIPPSSLDIEMKIVEYGQYLRYEVERYIKNTLLHWDANENFTIAIEGIKRNKLITDDDLDKIKGIYSFCNWTTSHVDIGDDHGLEQLKEKISEFLAVSSQA